MIANSTFKKLLAIFMYKDIKIARTKSKQKQISFLSVAERSRSHGPEDLKFQKICLQ